MLQFQVYFSGFHPIISIFPPCVTLRSLYIILLFLNSTHSFAAGFYFTLAFIGCFHLVIRQV